ncbi:type 1 glutamine amidotransferase [Arthrobacter sp. V4I6]|uniref:ThuA domain-containing protein n=1 Tax=unclassified Arthrobacter TaxID=235627 RepID=UPI002789271F|nr:MULTISPECIES: ThuA domain-containing protein [unclassified Arthrobacter]MDQ0822883.1 type 1 glutamine amidotransferase [Arthrobacter sp. V1I7]MDQ0852512.1 type 1 glutamine amidotransferase [Arthrobacter sp. V4I6]
MDNDAPTPANQPPRRAQHRARTLRVATALLPVVLAVGALSPAAAAVEPADDSPRVLVWGGAYGFRHPSITTGEKTMLELAQKEGKFSATVTENPADLSMANLRNYDVLMWVSTTGKAPMTEQQREEVMRWSSCGGGNLGIHAALDSEYGWAEHSQLFGAQFDSHPHGAGDAPARIQVENHSDPTVAGWAGSDSFELSDEYYRWRGARGVPGISLPRNLPGTDVLLSLDETSVREGIQTGSQPYEDDQPIAWKRTYGEGRVFYNNMGHNDSTWSDPAYQGSIVSAIDWLSDVRPDRACLDADLPLPAGPQPPAPVPNTIGKPCPVPATRETNATADPRTVSTTDSQALAGGLPGNLGWGGQTWVVDLSASRAKTATVTVDLTWTLPTDDYDLSITTGWGYYGSDNPTGSTREVVVLKDVPHCAVLQVAGDNMLAPSMSGTVAGITVSPDPRRLS